MLLFAFWPVRAEASHVILADVLTLVNNHRRSRQMESEITTLRALEAKSAIELWTDFIGEAMTILIEIPIFIGALLWQKRVPVQALIASIAVAVLFEEFAKRLPVLQVFMQESAMLAFFA